MGQPLKVLMVEDSEADAVLLLRELRRGGYDVTYERVDSPDATRRALESGTWDVVLSDFMMPGFGAMEALALANELGRDIPFIVASGTMGEITAVECMRAGARDFIVKDRLARLLPAIAREVREASLRRAERAERARGEAERESLLAELQQAVQARDTFLTIAAHELRTPLTTLQLTVGKLERLHDEASLVSMPLASLSTVVERIARQTDRLCVLVENLLDVTRITANCLTLSRDAVDLAEIVTEVVAQFNGTARHPGSEIVLTATKAVGVWDRFRIGSVVTNLISNAVKFGGDQPIEVVVSGDEQLARLTIVDHGLGISPEDQARIFNKFERAVPEKNYGGLGVGLWITRQVVEAHGGQIHVASEPGKGSTFTVELPLEHPPRTT